jgi:hypothetical protein
MLSQVSAAWPRAVEALRPRWREQCVFAHRHFQPNSPELVHVDDKFQAPQRRGILVPCRVVA